MKNIRRSLLLAFYSTGRTGVDSYAHLGSQYEEIVRQVLGRSLNLQLTVVGGCGDGGVDLRGLWKPDPTAPDLSVQVLVQCKRIDRPCSPTFIRDLEGACLGNSGSHRGVIGIMACTSDGSLACKEHLLCSTLPLGLMNIPEDGQTEGPFVKSALFNRNVYKLLPALLVAVRKNLTGRSAAFYYKERELRVK